MNKKVVYTAIFGGKDSVKDIDFSDDIDHVLFTDDPNLESDKYTTYLVPPLYEDPVRSAKYYKIMAHEIFPAHHYSLWIDGNIEVKNVDINLLFDEYLRDLDLAFHLHPIRDCIYSEAEKCIEIEKDNPAVIRNQMEYYRNQKHPENGGLISGSIIFRKNSMEVQKFNEFWWSEICSHSRRDQLSLPFVLRKLNIKFFAVPGHIRNQNVEGFRLHGHQKPDYRNW